MSWQQQQQHFGEGHPQPSHASMAHNGSQSTSSRSQNTAPQDSFAHNQIDAHHQHQHQHQHQRQHQHPPQIVEPTTAPITSATDTRERTASLSSGFEANSLSLPGLAQAPKLRSNPHDSSDTRQSHQQQYLHLQHNQQHRHHDGNSRKGGAVGKRSPHKRGQQLDPLDTKHTPPEAVHHGFASPYPRSSQNGNATSMDNDLNMSGLMVDLSPVSKIHKSLNTTMRGMFKILKPLDASTHTKNPAPSVLQSGDSELGVNVDDLPDLVDGCDYLFKMSKAAHIVAEAQFSRGQQQQPGQAVEMDASPDESQSTHNHQQQNILGATERGMSLADAEALLAAKPPLSFPCMMVFAILDTAEKRSTVSGIYAWIKGKFPYFANVEVGNGWKSCVRNGLSLNSHFKRVSRQGATRAATNGKGSFWSLKSASLSYMETRLIASLTTAPSPSPQAPSLSSPMPPTAAAGADSIAQRYLKSIQHAKLVVDTYHPVTSSSTSSSSASTPSHARLSGRNAYKASKERASGRHASRALNMGTGAKAVGRSHGLDPINSSKHRVAQQHTSPDASIGDATKIEADARSRRRRRRRSPGQALGHQDTDEQTARLLMTLSHTKHAPLPSIPQSRQSSITSATISRNASALSGWYDASMRLNSSNKDTLMRLHGSATTTHSSNSEEDRTDGGPPRAMFTFSSPMSLSRATAAPVDRKPERDSLLRGVADPTRAVIAPSASLARARSTASAHSTMSATNAAMSASADINDVTEALLSLQNLQQ